METATTSLLTVAVSGDTEVSLSAVLTIVDINPDDVPLVGIDGTYHERYILGYDDGTVRPDNNITRAEAAAIFFRIADDPDKQTKRVSSFKDISNNDWYYDAVAYLEDKGVVSGYGDDSFRPNDKITRAEFAKMAIIFMRVDQETISHSFNDVPSSHWAVAYIATAAAKGWVVGFDDGSFRPDNNITRAEVVSIINNLLNRKIESDDIPASAVQFKDLPKSHWAYAAIVEASSDHDFERKSNGFELWDK